MQNEKIKLLEPSMAGYNCTTEYKTGTENMCADLLFRKPDAIHAEDQGRTL